MEEEKEWNYGIASSQRGVNEPLCATISRMNEVNHEMIRSMTVRNIHCESIHIDCKQMPIMDGV
jgi:hypothetical protein